MNYPVASVGYLRESFPIRCKQRGTDPKKIRLKKNSAVDMTLKDFYLEIEKRYEFHFF